MKKTLIPIIVVLLSVILCFTLTACDGKKVDLDDKFKQNWMSNLDDSAKIADIVMPGTHDAGSLGMMSMAQTQDTTVYEQLMLGVRYFDIRVAKKGDKLVIFHGIIKGMPFSDVLADVKKFAELYPQELMVLDFQHFENDVENEVADLLASELSADTKAVPNTAAINTLTLGECKTKGYNLIIAWGSSAAIDSHDYIFPRDTALKSPYDGAEHQKGADNLIKTFDKYFAKSDGSTLFVLQSQLTPKSVESQKSLEDKFRSVANDYLKQLKTTPDRLAKINIVMRDFIATDPNTIRIILSLNLDKGLVKDSAIDAFTKNTAIK